MPAVSDGASYRLSPAKFSACPNPLPGALHWASKNNGIFSVDPSGLGTSNVPIGTNTPVLPLDPVGLVLPPGTKEAEPPPEVIASKIDVQSKPGHLDPSVQSA